MARRFNHIACCGIALAILGAVAQPLSAADGLAGVFGTDDRRPMTTGGSPWDAVGQINVAGYRRVHQCTGTLIAPDRVLTAAHCVVDARSGRTFPLHHVHFVAGARGGAYVAHGKARCISLASETQSVAAPGDARLAKLVTDAAIIVLEKPLSIAPAAIATTTQTAPDAPLTHVAYPLDRRHVPMAHRGCKRIDGAPRSPVWATDCDTHMAGSGGPVFEDRPSGPELAAIMLGVVPGRWSIALPVTSLRALLATTNCTPQG